MADACKKNLFVFDFDSTLVEVESLDELLITGLEKNGKTELIPEIEKITDMGMNGEINLQESIRRRLALAELKQEDIEDFQQKVVKQITPGIPEIIAWLQSQGHIIYIISGGFLNCILPVAKALNIPEKNCLANTYTCNAEGVVTEVDEENPLVRSNGKCQLIYRLKQESDCPVVVVGDGYSDLVPWKNGMADYFLGFGVNVKRSKIEQEAEHYFTKTEDLLEFVKKEFACV